VRKLRFSTEIVVYLGNGSGQARGYYGYFWQITDPPDMDIQLKNNARGRCVAAVGCNCNTSSS